MWTFTKANRAATCLCERAYSASLMLLLLLMHLFVIYWDASELSLAKIIRIYESPCAVSGRPEASLHTSARSRNNWLWSLLSLSKARSFITTYINTDSLKELMWAFAYLCSFYSFLCSLHWIWSLFSWVKYQPNRHIFVPTFILGGKKQTTPNLLWNSSANMMIRDIADLN